MNSFQFEIINEDDESCRLDKYLTENVSAELSRSYVQKLIKQGHVKVNGKAVKSNYLLRLQDQIELNLPEPVAYELQAEDLPLNIVFEDDDLLVINKEPGVVVHPAYGHMSGTLVNALMHHCTELSGLNGVMRPGIVHRLDKDTSGLMLVAKNDVAHRKLSEQLQDRSLSRIYDVIVKGVFPEEGVTCQTQIGRSSKDRKLMAVLPSGGKEAISRFDVKQAFLHTTHIQAKLSTGRTHQIRVHLKHLNYPVFGDPVYARSQNLRLGKKLIQMHRQALHASQIAFMHPLSEQAMEFAVPLPADMQEVLDLLQEYDL